MLSEKPQLKVDTCICMEDKHKRRAVGHWWRHFLESFRYNTGGYELIGCWTHRVTLNYDPSLWFSRSIFKKLYTRNRRVDWHRMKGKWVDKMLGSLCDFDLGLSRSFFNSHIPGIRWLTNMEQKRCKSIRCWTYYVRLTLDFTHDLELGCSKSKFQWLCGKNGTKGPWPWIFKVKFRTLSEESFQILLQCMAKTVFIHLLYMYSAVVGTPGVRLGMLELRDAWTTVPDIPVGEDGRGE